MHKLRKNVRSELILTKCFECVHAAVQSGNKYIAV